MNPFKRVSRERPAEVLLIDDSRGDAALAVYAFSQGPIPVNLTIASTGENALEILQQRGEYAGKILPDIILLDLTLPRMSGFDVLVTIKSDERFRRIPVIVMSSSGSGQNIMKCYQRYANAYLIKPNDIGEYRQAIEKIGQMYFVQAVLAD